MDNSSVNFIPGQMVVNLSMHEGQDEYPSVMFGRGGFGYNRSQRLGFRGGQQGGFRVCQQPHQKMRPAFPRNTMLILRQFKCEYCYMQNRGQAKQLDYNHDITNCPVLVAKFSRINIAEGETSDQDEDETREFEEFYESNL